MKKTIIGLLLFLSVSLCFAGGKVEGGIGYHGMIMNDSFYFEANQDYPELFMDVNETFSSFAINFAFITLLSESFGLGLHGNFLLRTEEEVFPFNGVDFFVGPVFTLYNSEKKSVTLSPGMHFSFMLLDDQTMSKQIGLGGNVKGEYYLSKNVYAFASFLLSCDFYSWHSHGGTSGGNAISGFGGKQAQEGSGNIFAWNINPYVGLGYKL